MVQRAMIAMALAFRPALLIADEPTTSLDVTIQVQIIELLKEVTAEFRTSLLLISHDLGIASRLCNRIAVMYAGSVVEYGKLRETFTHPEHPYTLALLDAANGKEDRLLEGFVPELSRLPEGCRFHPRCPWTRQVCREVRPEMDKGVRCHLRGRFSSRECA
jgi:peptide/nickel transport system ATP-binding protein